MSKSINLKTSEEIIKYSESDVQSSIVFKGRYSNRVKSIMGYLENHLPINKVTKKNTFNFSKLKFHEGKNYDWFFLVNGNVQLLIRQYRLHFTIFAINKKEKSYSNKSSIFTIDTDFDRVVRSPENDKLSDKHCDNNFLTFQALLPLIFEKVEADEVHTLWNSLCFPTEKHTKAKAVFIGDESVYCLNTTIFAMDEISNIYGQYFAQNEVLEQLKTLSVGDAFGSAYTISSIKTEVKNNYYHAVGLRYYSNDDETKKETWSDVYSLSRFYFSELFFGNHKEKINEFIYENHDTVFLELLKEFEDKPIYFDDIIYNTYYKMMYDLYSKEHKGIELKDFISFISKDYNKFLYYSFTRARKKKQK